MKRTIKQLSRYEMLVIATEYANTPYSVSGDFFSERYEVSKNTFYNILHKVIIESIVTLDIAKQIAKKAVAEASDIREEKVSELKTRVQSGNYSVDSGDFASMLLAKYNEMKK